MPDVGPGADHSGQVLSPAPPQLAQLRGLPRPLWRRLVPHVRKALAGLDDGDHSHRSRQLAALPTSRLLSGRARNDVLERLAAGGPLWIAVRQRILLDGALAETLASTLDEPGPPPKRESPPRAARPDDDGEQVAQLRARLRRLRHERDDARRRAQGETARADRESVRSGALEAERAQLQAAIAALEQRLQDGEADRVAAVDRERRRAETAMTDLKEQLRELRREREERNRAWQAARAAQDVVARRPDPVAVSSRPLGLVPGRPSWLPEAVHEETTEAADLLLHADRVVLVDGYNVSRTHRGHLDLLAQRQWLVGLLVGAVATRRIRPTVVFDGYQAPGPGSSQRDRGVHVVFTADGVTADDDLVFQAEAADPAMPLVVVTDDRELRERLAGFSLDLLSTRGFVGALR